MISCNQIMCKYNIKEGCLKPEWVDCSMSNTVPSNRSVTNGDRIRALSDEDLAKIIFDIAWDGEYIHWIDAEKWLGEPDNGYVDRVLKEGDGNG